jgi:hypothetical protein
VKRQGSALPELSDAAGTATHALGLPGFVVLAAAEYGGELELLIETTESVTGCPGCGVVATLHDRRPRWVRDPLTQSPYVLFDSTPLNLVPVTENVLGSVHQVGVVDGRRRSIRRHGVQLVPRFCPLSSSSLHRLTRPTSALFRVQASARYPIGYAGRSAKV